MQRLFDTVVLTLTLMALLISTKASGQSENIEQDKDCKRNIKIFRRKIKAKKNIRILCCITGHPFPEITWYKDESELSMPHGSTVIHNVRYQQKGTRLLISRTDVSGSGHYHCLARNSAGYKTGGTYEVILYENKQQNFINATNFTGAITRVKTTVITFRRLGGNFLAGPNETVNYEYKFIPDRSSKEEEDEKEAESQNKTSQSEGMLTPSLIGVFVGFAVFALGALGLVVWFRKRNSASTEREDVRHPTLVPTPHRRCRLWPATLRGGHKETAETHDDSIDENLQSTSYATTRISKSSKFKKYQIEISPKRFQSCSDVTSGFDVSPQNIASTSSSKIIPSVSPKSCSCSAIDGKEMSAEPCVFCSVNDLSVNTDVGGTDLTATNRRQTSSIPSPRGSNTSELFDEYNKIPPNTHKSYVASKFIDHDGGEVILTDTGIKLVIPEGAIEKGKTEVIQLALLDNPAYAPKENDGDTSLTPVVMCGPHGLRFKKHVMLVLPHCVAVSDELEENFRVLCSDTAPEIAPDWKEIFNNKDEPDKEVFCNMGEQQFCLFLRHFTWYTIRGEGRAMNFSVAAYHTSFHQPNEEFKVRIYFIPILRDSSVAQKRVDEAEKRLQGTLSDGKKIMIFHKTGGDIKVDATEISEGWVVNQNVQTQSRKVLSVCREESPNQTFRFKHMAQRPDQISSTFRVSQADCKFDTPVDISVSLHFESEIRRSLYQKNRHASDASTCSSGLGKDSVESATPTTSFITNSLRTELILLLDRDTLGGKNWKDLAEHLGFKQLLIRWLDRPRIESPTEKLLMEWEFSVNYERPENALAFLQQKLLEIGRKDAADAIKEHLRSTRGKQSVPIV